MKKNTMSGFGMVLALCLLASTTIVAQNNTSVNLLSNGGFETDRPAYWTPSGAGADWSTEQSRTPHYSLKLSGSGSSAWTMEEAVRNWVPGIPAGGTPELIIGGWVYVSGVNTNPANDDEKFQLVYEFFDDQGNDVLGAPVVLDVPQDAASSGGWVELSSESLGAITLPSEQAAKRVTITFRKGANATGTVYMDDIFLRPAPGAEGWVGDWFNANVDMGDTWYYWYPDFGFGNEGWPETQSFMMTRTNEDARSGDYSLRIEQLDPAASEAVAISERVPVTVGEPVLASFWVRYEGVPDPETIGEGTNNIGMVALFYSSMESGTAGYNEIGGIDIMLNGEFNSNVIPLAPRVESTGWTQYAFVVYPLENSVGMEMRLRYANEFEGVTYWDDVFIAPVSEAAGSLEELLSNGGFETDRPAYWTPSGAGADWSTEQSRTPHYSLKLSGSGSSAWTMEEAVRNWVPGIPAGGTPELIIGGWVYVSGVNTNPANDDEKFQLVYEFFDDQGNDVLGAPVVLDVPQDAASSGGWVELSSESLGAITLPSEQAAKRVTITFRKGANATGTVYMDDIFLRPAPGAEGWVGDWFNANVDMGDTWYYWYPDFGFGNEGWPETQSFMMTRTNEDARSGDYSLRIEQLDPAASEAVAISERVPVTVGEPVLASFWVRYEGVPDPETIGEGTNNIGMVALFYSSMESGTAGYNEIGGIDIMLNGEFNSNVIPLAPRVESTGWTQYAFVVYPLENSVGMEMRLRYANEFEGVTYWDDVSIVSLGDLNIGGTFVSIEDGRTEERPGRIHLGQNYPNPFNPTTIIGFELPAADVVTLEVYNMLGQKVAELLKNSMLGSGRHNVEFNASGLPSGVYLYRLNTNSFSESRKMMLIK
ncbi:MAG: T9SS type A sorting domain-containing protein [Cyclonatronaceae bacterium]